jgi:tetratricopeptide (TPR) repeat protein
VVLGRSALIKTFLTLSLVFLISAAVPAAQAEPNSYSPEVADQLSRGTALLRDGKLGEARQAFQRAVEFEPKCHEAWNNIGLTYYREGNLDKAAEAYMNAIELEPGFVPSITNLGAVRHQQRKLDKATGLYRLALDLSQGKDAEIQYNYANVLRDQKNYEKAREHYLKSIELRPEFPAAHNGLGATYFCLKKFNDAEREIKYAIKLKPDYALAYYHLGLLEAGRERYPEAIKAYEDSLKYEDRKDYADDTREKIARLREQMRRGPESVSASAGPPMLGKSNFASGMSTSASLFEQKMGTGAIVEQKMGNAVKEFENLLKSGGSNDPVLWNNYGLSLLHEGPSQTDEAIKKFKNAIRLGKGKLYQANYNLAQAYRAKGDLLSCDKECVRAIEAARAQNTVCPLVHNLRAIVLKQKGQFANADQEYKLAIAQSMGKYPVFHYNRALNLERLNKQKEAKQEYQAYIDSAPNGLNISQAKLRLNLLCI